MPDSIYMVDIASSAGKIRLVRLLLKHDADPSITGESNSNGLTAIMLAPTNGRAFIVKMHPRCRG